MFIYSYNNDSRSANALKQALGAKFIRTVNSRFVGGQNKKVINWGNSSSNEQVTACNVLNTPDCVKFATNKFNFFEKCKEAGVSIPEYTLDLDVVTEWVAQGDTVFVRETLSGYGGRGITIIDSMRVWEDYNHSNAKMYVKYIPKKDEYRVHIFKGAVIDVQKKSFALGDRPSDFRIRNKDFGFIFTRGNANPPQDVLDQALKAMEVTGLDFGGVDVIYNEYREKAYALEVNTAVGLEGTTLTKYVQAFSSYFEQEVNPTLDQLTPAPWLELRAVRMNQQRNEFIVEDVLEF